MDKYYIIRPDGSSIFSQPFPFDFCMHCLMLLIDNPSEELRNCRLLSIDSAVVSFYRATAIRPTRPGSVSSQTVPDVTIFLPGTN